MKNRLRAALLAAAMPAVVQAGPAGDASRVSVLVTPSFVVQIEVHCAEGNVRCDDVTYTGKSRKTGAAVSVRGRTLHLTCADGRTPCRFLGYRFDSGRVNYTVLEEGELIVTRSGKTLVRGKGRWKQE